MRRRTLGNSDLVVADLCLGTADFGATVKREEAFAMLDAYVAEGGNFLDTAAVYAEWIPGCRRSSETLLGRWFAARGGSNDLVVATKGGHPPLTAMHEKRLDRASLEADLAESLRLLGRDRIDLYWLHRDDPARPVEDILETLELFVRDGKVRWYGFSNWKQPRAEAARVAAARHGARGFVASQLLWSAAALNPGGVGDPTLAAMDADYLAWHAAQGVAAVPYSSQANGYFQRLLTFSLGGAQPWVARMYDSAANRSRAARIESFCRAHGRTPTSVVLGWLLAQPIPVFPIVGPKTCAQLHDCIAGIRSGATLTAAQAALL